MLNDFKVTMLLADSAQAVNNKLYVLGGGWDIAGPGAPSAVAVKVDVPWDRTNRKHRWELVLEDDDGRPVNLPNDRGGFAALKLGDEFEVGRPPGVKEGTPMSVALAINISPLPLTPGSRYVWRFSINHASDPAWELPFSVVNLDRATP